jgi:hypothetical protein
MPAATKIGGALIAIPGCYVKIPNSDGPEFVLEMKVLPEISDTKGATYADEPVMGRSSPVKTYSHSDNRQITMQIHMIVSSPNDVEDNLRALRAIQSAVYPRNGMNSPFVPPPVCRIKCGRLLAETDLCVVLRNYNVKFPTEVAWDEDTFVPFKFDIETSWEVVYKSSDLPGSERIFQSGR